MSILSYRTRTVVRCKVCDAPLSDGARMKYKLCQVHAKLKSAELLEAYM